MLIKLDRYWPSKASSVWPRETDSVGWSTDGERPSLVDSYRPVGSVDGSLGARPDGVLTYCGTD